MGHTGDFYIEHIWLLVGWGDINSVAAMGLLTRDDGKLDQMRTVEFQSPDLHCVLEKESNDGVC